MMKQKWVRPMAVVQTFVANEYVAACGDNGKVYKFKCDAAAGTLYFYPRGKDYWAVRLGKYHPCGREHEAAANSGFYDGFVDYNGNEKEDDGEAVIVWRGPSGFNGHATTNLDIDSWEVEKS